MILMGKQCDAAHTHTHYDSNVSSVLINTNYEIAP